LSRKAQQAPKTRNSTVTGHRPLDAGGKYAASMAAMLEKKNVTK
jgi:hypothetical protein